MRMWIYVVRRLMLLIPIIIGVMTITFVLISALPVTFRLVSAFGVPKSGQIGPTYPCPNNISAECPNPWYVNGVHQLGLDQPVPVQWAKYMYNSLTFNWGTVSSRSYLGASSPYSFTHNTPVATVLGWLLPYTLELAALSLLIILIVAIPLGNLSAVYRNRPIDQASRVMSFSGYALPAFLLGSFLLMGFVILFGAGHGWVSLTCASSPTYLEFYHSWPPASCFPGGALPTWLTHGVVSSPTGFPTVDAVYHGQYGIALDTVIRMLIPAFVIAYGSIAGLLRFVRNSMLEVMNLDFVRTARAKGVPEPTVIKRHAGRNSLNVTITVLGLTFAFFIAGFPVVEEVFGLTGVGSFLAYSINSPFDFGVIFGSTLLFTYLVVSANIIVDILYAYLDPRVRLG
jgi:ABC-type dipeptide/oligopeptide/nickel transport system permease component